MQNSINLNAASIAELMKQFTLTVALCKKITGDQLKQAEKIRKSLESVTISQIIYDAQVGNFDNTLTELGVRTYPVTRRVRGGARRAARVPDPNTRVEMSRRASRKRSYLQILNGLEDVQKKINDLYSNQDEDHEDTNDDTNVAVETEEVEKDA